MRWRLFCLKLRYLFRDPYDAVDDRAMVELIDDLDSELASKRKAQK